MALKMCLKKVSKHNILVGAKHKTIKRKIVTLIFLYRAEGEGQLFAQHAYTPIGK